MDPVFDNEKGYDVLLRAGVLNCYNCPWKEVKKASVPPEGPPDAEIMVVGRNPGREEDLFGSPFYKKAPGGAALNRFLTKAEINREKIRVTNVAKCYGGLGDPPPTQEVFLSCRPWLFAELCLVQPKLIITLGNDALFYVTGNDGSSLTLEGEILRFKETESVVFVVSHPGYWVRQPKHQTKVMTEVAQKLKKTVQALGIESAKVEEGLFSDD